MLKLLRKIAVTPLLAIVVVLYGLAFPFAWLANKIDDDIVRMAMVKHTTKEEK